MLSSSSLNNSNIRTVIQDEEQHNMRCNNNTKITPLQVNTVSDNEASKSRINDYTDDAHLYMDTSLYNNKLPIESQIKDIIMTKTVSITYDTKEKAGEEWKIVRLMITINDYISKYRTLLQQKKLQLIRMISTLIVLTISCTVYLWNVIVNSFDLNLFLLLFGLFYSIFSSQKLYKFLFNPSFELCLLPYYMWARLIYFVLLGLASLALLMNHRILEGVIYTLLLYLTAVFYSLLVTFCVIGIPFLIIAAVTEFIIRFFTCHLQCPYQRAKKRTFIYGVYRFGHVITKEANKCAICLEEYNLRDKDLVVLECKTDHIFHEKCLLEWIRKNDYCPICRGSIKFYTKERLQCK